MTLTGSKLSEKDQPFLQRQQQQRIHLMVLRAAIEGLNAIKDGQVVNEQAGVAHLHSISRKVKK